jgi:hypothetical protein
MSYTEKEYRYAVDKGIPVAAFVIDKGATWSEDHEHIDAGTAKYDKYEHLRKLDEFKKFVARDKMIRTWKDTGELQTACFGAIKGLIEKSPRSGWVRGDAPHSTPPQDTSPVPELAIAGSPRTTLNLLEQAKQAVLFLAHANPAGTLVIRKIADAPGTHVVIAGVGFSKSRKQQQLFLEVVKTLLSEGFLEKTGNEMYHLTFSGLEAAEKIPAISNPEAIGLD